MRRFIVSSLSHSPPFVWYSPLPPQCRRWVGRMMRVSCLSHRLIESPPLASKVDPEASWQSCHRGQGIHIVYKPVKAWELKVRTPLCWARSQLWLLAAHRPFLCSTTPLNEVTVRDFELSASLVSSDIDKYRATLKEKKKVEQCDTEADASPPSFSFS